MKKYVFIVLFIFTELLTGSEPSITPKRNYFYKEFPTGIFAKVNLQNEKIISVTNNGKELSFSIKKYPYQKDAVILELSGNELLKLNAGEQEIMINFTNGFKVNFALTICEKRENAGLIIIAPYVGHGSSVLFILPDKKVLLVDCGKDWVRDSIIIPMLKNNGIKKLDYFFITHYHDDHDGGDRGGKIKKLFHPARFFDYKSFKAGETFKLGGADFKILNSYTNGTDENSRSLSFKLSYKGFVYVHGADTYAINQQRIMHDFPGDIEADVFFANHHFYGSIDVDYLRAVNPVIVILQVHEAMYENRAYMDYFKSGVVKYLIENKKRFIEDLPTLETGTVVIRVNSKNDWHYETLGSDQSNYTYKLF